MCDESMGGGGYWGTKDPLGPWGLTQLLSHREEKKEKQWGINIASKKILKY